MKSGSLNVLELSGPVQACTGIAVPLTLPDINSSLLQAVQHRVRTGQLLTAQGIRHVLSLLLSALRTIKPTEKLCSTQNVPLTR